jgi:glycosidase
MRRPVASNQPREGWTGVSTRQAVGLQPFAATWVATRRWLVGIGAVLAIGFGGIFEAGAAFADQPPLVVQPVVPPVVPASQPRTEPTSINGISLAKRPDVSYQASPTTWQREVLTMLMVDRFNPGTPTTPENLERQPNEPKGWHGGNITGITAKLDYLKGQGKTSIWITPVLGNGSQPGAYHGYWITDFFDTEKHFGTLGDLTTLVKEAHARNMRVILDVVVNHTGRVFEYTGKDEFDPSGQKKEIAKWNTQIYPRELQSPDNFNRRGTVTQKWDADETLNGDFIDGLRDFDLNKRDVQDKFIKIYKYVVARTGVDGFRVDTVKHVPESFWPRFNREIKEYAAKTLGMENFGTFPEFYAATPDDMRRLISPQERGYAHIDPEGRNGNMGFTAALDFPSYFGELAPLRGLAPTRQMEETRNGLKSALTTSQLNRTGGFLDNHDVERFLRGDKFSKAQLKVALARMYFRAGIPVTQYGTEQGMRQIETLPIDPGNRADMFDGDLKWSGANANSFNTKAPLYRIERMFKDVRDTYAPLTGGEEWVRWSDPNGPGLFAFSRMQDGKEVVVVVNTADEPREAGNVAVDRDVWRGRLGQGPAKLVDALHPGYATDVVAVSHDEGGRKVYQGAQIGNVRLPPHGVRVLVYDREYVPIPLRQFDPEGHEIVASSAAKPALVPSAAALPKPGPAPHASGSAQEGRNESWAAAARAPTPTAPRDTPRLTIRPPVIRKGPDVTPHETAPPATHEPMANPSHVGSMLSPATHPLPGRPAP